MNKRDEDAARVREAMAVAAMARDLAENLPVNIERQRVIARFLFIKFQALIAEGFNEQQALQLVK